MTVKLTVSSFLRSVWQWDPPEDGDVLMWDGIRRRFEPAAFGAAPASKYGAAGLIDGQYGNDAEFDNGNSGTSKTIDWNNGNQQRCTLTDACIFTLTHPKAAHRYLLVLAQGGEGGFGATFTDVYWLNGEAPDFTAGVTGDLYIVTFARTGEVYIGNWNGPMQPEAA